MADQKPHLDEVTQGTVEKRTTTSGNWYSVPVSTFFGSGNWARTPANSRAVISLGDGSKLKLKPLTTAQFNDEEEFPDRTIIGNPFMWLFSSEADQNTFEYPLVSSSIRG